jgi:hypothetical protein
MHRHPCPWAHEGRSDSDFPIKPGARGLKASVWRCLQGWLTYPLLSSALQKLQDMDERRATRLGAGYGLLSEAELQVVPIIGKCLEGMKVAAESVDAKNVGTQHAPGGDG